MMYRKQFTVFLFVVLSSNLVSASELDEAIVYGELLTRAVKDKAEIKLKKLPEFEEIERYLSENECPGYKYKGYIVGPEGAQFLYLVGSVGKNVIVGRHFKAPIEAGSISVDAFESSTNSCLNLGVPPSNAVAMVVTHLKPFPNEFHLLQSNLRSIALYVGTRDGKLFSVDKGTITLVKEDIFESDPN